MCCDMRSGLHAWVLADGSGGRFGVWREGVFWRVRARVFRVAGEGDLLAGDEMQRQLDLCKCAFAERLEYPV